MGKLKIGDIVARKSYGYDIFFKVVDIKKVGNESIVTLKGISYRIQADAPESDLVLQPDERVNDYVTRSLRTVEKKCRDIFGSKSRNFSKKALYRNTPKANTRKFSKPGKVLHIDGDSDYLETCLKEYKKIGIEAIGKSIPEKDQVLHVSMLLKEYSPDILVLTGHDGVAKGKKDLTNLNNYINSKYFTEAVKEARRYNPDLDSLVIFAGACQSMYSEIIRAGANFASSPERVLIHALDPVLVCQKVAFTGINSIVEPSDVIQNTVTGIQGIGGLQTRGKFRNGLPEELNG